MVRARTSPVGLARVAFLTLAFLAIVMRVAIPAGYMAAPTNDLPFAIVLCTSDGAVTVEPGEALPDHGGGKGERPDKGKDSPCAFAGLNAAATAPDTLSAAPAVFAAYAPILPSAVRDLAPGRGLTAPPPPATGPPSQLI